MSDYAKIFQLSSDSAEATKTSALKTYFRSVRLIKDTNTLSPNTIPSYITNILLCGNCIDPENRNLYVFYIDTSAIGSAWIIEINIDTREQVVVYYDKYNAIGFDPKYKIYNARVVHGRLVWTDNKNPIYQMDILRAKKSFDLKIGYGQYLVTVEWSSIVTYGIDQIVSNGNNFYKSKAFANLNHEPRTDNFVNDIGVYWIKLCLIEDAYYSMDVKNFYFEPVPPKHPPVVSYESDDTRKINNLRQTLFQVAYRYVYMDWRKSTFSPASIVPVPQAEEETATGLANEMISLNNKLNIKINTGGEEVRAIEIIGRSSEDPSKWFLIETVDKFTEQERGGEVSVSSEPGYISLTMAVMIPTVVNINMPSVPVAIAASAITQSSFTANWLASLYADGYYLDVSTSNVFTSFVFQNIPVSALSINIGSMLNQGVTYYYRVRAYNAAGISGYSNVITLGITGHWILADEILDTFDAYSPDNFAIGVSIGTDINAVNEAGGWHILSHPSWVDVTVWNPITSRVADPPYYQGLQIKVDTNSTNTGAYRSGNIVLTDDSGNVLATIAVSQYGGPPTAYCVAFGSWTLLTSSAVVSAGSPILNLSYSVDNFSDITQNMWISVFRNGIEVAYVPKATRNYPPYTQTMNITMNENAIGGGVYAVVISSIEGHTLP